MASARLGPRDLAIPVDAVEDCIEKAALRQFIRLFEDECAAWMAFPGKLALYRQGLSILVDPELLTVGPDHPLGNAGGFFQSFTLDGYGIDNLHAVRQFFQGLEGKVSADFGAGAHRRDKADAVQPIIDSHARAILDLQHLGHELRKQGKREKAVRDGVLVG